MIEDLISWSKQNYSHLPWRRNRSLYGTLVSEIMLQQTTVSTVLNHFERFLEKYPNIEALAKATEEELLIQWKGLGYYRRARNLHKACKYFFKEHRGKIPLNYDQLVKAPGIGDYTANAILAIGADKKAICLDANLERVLSRLYYIEEEKGPKLIKKLHKLFSENEIAKELEQVSARDYNEALMDLGRVYCQANKADCLVCPLSQKCKSFGSTDVLSIPIRKEKKIPKYYELKLLRCFVFKNDKILAYQKGKGEWLEGQWECPTFIIESEDKTLKQYPKLKTQFDYDLLPMVKTGITKYKIENYVLVCDKGEFEKILSRKVGSYTFLKAADKQSNLSTATSKCLELIN